MARRKGSLGERVGDVSIARAGVQVGFFVFLLVQLFKEGVWVVFFWWRGSGAGGGRRERGGRFCWCGCRWSRFEDLSEDGSARESYLGVVVGQEEMLSRLRESRNG